MDLLRKNKLIVGLIAITIVILGLGGYLLWIRAKNQTITPSQEEQNVRQIDASEIGLELTFRSDKKAVIITASKLSGIASLEYELTYDAQVQEEGETHAIPRGAIGKLTIRGGEASSEVDLGTCSANICKYDKVVSDIKVIIKVNYENGEVAQVEDKISFEE